MREKEGNKLIKKEEKKKEGCGKIGGREKYDDNT